MARGRSTKPSHVARPVHQINKELSLEQGTHEYECTNCGYTLFVAKGREFKFFGDNFRCAGCGKWPAPKVATPES